MKLKTKEVKPFGPGLLRGASEGLWAQNCSGFIGVFGFSQGLGLRVFSLPLSKDEPALQGSSGNRGSKVGHSFQPTN